MKNNCQMPEWIACFVIGFVIVIGCVHLGKAIEESQFDVENIIKETCEEENIFLYTYKVSVLRRAEDEFGDTYGVFNSSYIKEEEGSEFFIFFSEPYSTNVGSYYEKFELISKEFLRIETTCKQVEVEDFQIEIHYHNYSFNSILNKKDYLEENCICAYGCMKVDNDCLESCEVECPECLEYKCGDYFVEIK